MPYSSSEIFWRSSPILLRGIRCVRSGVLRRKPLITTAEPPAFPRPRSSRSPRDGCPHNPPYHGVSSGVSFPVGSAAAGVCRSRALGCRAGGSLGAAPGTCCHVSVSPRVGEEVTGSAVLPAASLPPARPTTLPMQIHPDRLGSGRPPISNLVLPHLACLLNMSVAS